MTDNPWLLLAAIAAALYFAKLWHDDLRAERRGQAKPGAFPGAAGAPTKAVVIAIAGILVLLGLETAGEHALGLTKEQSTLTLLLGVYTLAMAFLEELVFRGYLVVTRRGRAALIASIVGFSLLFAILHPLLGSWGRDSFSWQLSSKDLFSTAFIFLNSLWFYTVRFFPWNPRHSLLPCIAAHVAKNAGVFAIKAAQGYVAGVW